MKAPHILVCCTCHTPALPLSLQRSKREPTGCRRASHFGKSRPAARCCWALASLPSPSKFGDHFLAEDRGVLLWAEETSSKSRSLLSPADCCLTRSQTGLTRLSNASHHVCWVKERLGFATTGTPRHSSHPHTQRYCHQTPAIQQDYRPSFRFVFL